MAVTNETVSRVLNAVPKGLLIGGKWISTEKTIDVEDPSTGQAIAQVADATPGKSAAGLNEALVNVLKGRLGQAVAAHRMSKAAEQARLDVLRSRVSRLLARTHHGLHPAHDQSGSFVARPPGG